MTAGAARTGTGRHAAGWTAILAAAMWTSSQLWASRGYVPMWDGRVYADCIVRAATQPFSIEALRCGEHPSQAYVGLLSLVQRVAPGSFPVLLATNAALFVVAVLALARLLWRIAPAADVGPERQLLVSAFVVHPVVLASVVQPGLDFGAMVFLLLATVAAVERRPWALAACGTLAAFSKESGLLIYVLLAGTYVVTHALPHPFPRDLRNALLGAALGVAAGVSAIAAWPAGLAFGAALGCVCFALLRPRELPAAWAPARLAAHTRPLAMLAIPPVAFAAYLASRASRPNVSVLWQGEGTASIVRSLLVPQLGPTARGYLALAFVLGFLWVPSVVLVADLVVGARRFFAERPRRPTPGIDADALTLVTLLSVGSVYLLTRYVTFTNARYLLPAYPLLLALVLPSLIRLGVSPAVRLGLLSVIPLLFAWSAVRTADPVSRAVWGTFPVGAHRLLRITSLSGECCGAGRDQLVYNLQFTAFDRLVGKALDAVQPMARRRTIALSAPADWFVVGLLDTASARTLRTDRGVTTPRIVQMEALEAPGVSPAMLRPDTVWYLAMPNVDPVSPVGALEATYRMSRSDTVRADGYAMAVVTLTRRTELHSASTLPNVARPARTTRPVPLPRAVQR